MLSRACLLSLLLALPAQASELDDLLKDIRAVKAEGAGSVKARAAWDRLVRQGPAVLPRILAALDTPDTVAANWLRLAFDDIAGPALKAGGKGIDVDALLGFARDGKRQGRARRLALDVVEQRRPGTRRQLLAGWLDDPEFRYDAIEALLDRLRGEKDLPRQKVLAELRRAFRSSRDLAQARALAGLLKERGETVHVADHLGFLGDWYVIGPFDANGRRGFKTAYPPERKVDLDAVLEGKKSKKLRWQRFTTPESPVGRFPILVDLTKALGNEDDAVAFAWTAFEAPAARTVEFRGAADDNFTVWVNGKRVFGFEEYENGVRLDRHRFRVPLRKGVNTVLVKVCQAPRNAAPNWEFLLRITDPAGAGLTFPSALKSRRADARRPLPALACLFLALPPGGGDWPGWRGPGHDGLSGEKGLPVSWPAGEKVRWKVPVPGAGVSAPVVHGGRVFLTSSGGRAGEELYLFCFHRDDGRTLWQRRLFGTEVSEGQFAPGGMAVPTPAADGKRLFALYGTGDLVCVDAEGKPLWLRSLAQEYGPFRNRWGMASSPLLLDGLLVVQVDHYGKSYLVGIDPVTGRNRWRTPRDAAVNWTSPVAMRLGGRSLIVAAGTGTLEGYDAETGRREWSLPGLQDQCIPTPVARGERLWLACGGDFTSLCVRVETAANGRSSARVEWRVPSKGVGIPSPLCLGDYYYYAEDAGWAACLRADTGKPVWRRRLGGKVQASPVAADGKLYFAGVNGTVTVLRAGPEFKALAKNKVGEGLVASPALAQGCIFLRGEKHLFCIGR